MLQMNKRYFYLSILPAVLIFISLVGFPIYKIIGYSFTNFQLTKPGISTFVWFDQFVDAFTNPRFLWAAGRSVYFSTLSVLFTLILGFILAFLLNRKDIKGLGFFRVVILIPMLITPIVVGEVFKFLYDYDYGVINYFLNLLGFSKISFLASPGWALNSVLIADIWQWTPFAAIILLAGISGLPEEPLEAASLDGAGFWRTLFSIQIPMLKTIIGVIILIRFMDAFKAFDKIYALTSGGPGTSSETLSIYVWREGFEFFNTAYASATGLVMLLTVNIASILFVRKTNMLD